MSAAQPTADARGTPSDLCASAEPGGPRIASANEPHAASLDASLSMFAELVGIFSHDLSNPLQSVTVLLELAVDDSAPGTEEYSRLRQSLEAADRMRTLIRDFAGLARCGVDRESHATFGSVVAQVLGTLARRLDRHAILLHVDLGPIASLRVPCPSFALALAGIVLGVLDRAPPGSTGARLLVEGRLTTDRIVLGIESDLLGHPVREAPEEGQHLERAAALLGGHAIAFELEPRRVRVDFPRPGASLSS